MKIRFTIILLALLMVSMTGSAIIEVTTAEKVGHIKAMNGVNNGPMKADISQIRDNFTAYKAARIPFARTHDSSFEEAYGSEHTVDITAIFPDFSKDANDPIFELLFRPYFFTVLLFDTKRHSLRDPRSFSP